MEMISSCGDQHGYIVRLDMISFRPKAERSIQETTVVPIGGVTKVGRFDDILTDRVDNEVVISSSILFNAIWKHCVDIDLLLECCLLIHSLKV